MIRSTETLLRESASGLLEEARRCTDMGEFPDPSINWHGLAEVAGSRALDEQGVDATVWGEAAALLYALLAKNENARESFEHSEMMLRAALIRRLGIGEAAGILDPQVILRWFSGRCTITCEEAYAKSRAWRQLPIQEVRGLRRLKTSIAVIAVFRNRLSETELVNLNPWLDVWRELP